MVAIKGTSKAKVSALGEAWNQAMVSPLRMQVEQNIGHLQNWRILEGRYRARLENAQRLFLAGGGVAQLQNAGFALLVNTKTCLFCTP